MSRAERKRSGNVQKDQMEIRASIKNKKQKRMEISP